LVYIYIYIFIGGYYYVNIYDNDDDKYLIICYPQNIKTKRNMNSLMNKEISRCDIASSSYKGYFINSMDKKTNKLLYCTYYYNKCEDFIANNGYYFNSYSSDIIKCSNSKCKIFNNGSSCDNHYNEVIIYNKNPYFCNKDKPISFSEVEIYIELKNINANLNFPVIENGNDIILLKIDQYSVTQQITDLDGKKLFLLLLYKYNNFF